MKKCLIVLACVLSTSAIALETQRGTSQGAATPSPGTIQVAQVCGWFAIYYCSRGAGDAQRWASRNRGHVIDTSSARYPNFRGGYYCVVDGPTSHGNAVNLANSMRRVSSTSYAKNSC